MGNETATCDEASHQWRVASDWKDVTQIPHRPRAVRLWVCARCGTSRQDVTQG